MNRTFGYIVGSVLRRFSQIIRFKMMVPKRSVKSVLVTMLIILAIYAVLVPNFLALEIRVMRGSVPLYLVIWGKAKTLWSSIWSSDMQIDLTGDVSKHLFQYDPSKPTNYNATMSPNKTWKRAMSKYIIKRLKNKTNGFFVECGAFDGEYLSNTLMLERSYNWTGLLIEADQAIIPKLLKRNRYAWVADVCLSPKPEPVTVTMKGSKKADVLSFIPEFSLRALKRARSGFKRSFQVQCYPLHMLLDALGKDEVDYFSLDVEGLELDILKTIPWNRLHIQLLGVEVRRETRDAIRVYMESVGYKRIHQIVIPSDYIHDDVYERQKPANE